MHTSHALGGARRVPPVRFRPLTPKLPTHASACRFIVASDAPIRSAAHSSGRTSGGDCASTLLRQAGATFEGIRSSSRPAAEGSDPDEQKEATIGRGKDAKALTTVTSLSDLERGD